MNFLLIVCAFLPLIGKYYGAPPKYLCPGGGDAKCTERCILIQKGSVGKCNGTMCFCSGSTIYIDYPAMQNIFSKYDDQHWGGQARQSWIPGEYFVRFSNRPGDFGPATNPIMLGVPQDD